MCTKTELASISQRLVVAKMLSEKRVYSDIVEETGASTATISRVNRSLAFGKGGYEKIFAKLNK
jgi:TrpR-related protein YerC/YecD